MLDEVLSKCNNGPDDVNFAIFSIGISMKDMAMSDGGWNVVFGDDASMTDYQNTNEKTIVLFHRHKNSFLHSENDFDAISNLTHASTTHNHIRKSDNKRLFPNSKKWNQNYIKFKNSHKKNDPLVARTNQKSIPVCSFCGSKEPGDKLRSWKRSN